MILHILERAVIHIFSAGSVYLLAYFTLTWAYRKWPLWTGRILPALIAILIIFIREPVDVDSGGWVGKSYIDLGSWVVGMGLAIWGLIRFKKASADS